jgi:hypothetical protein
MSSKVKYVGSGVIRQATTPASGPPSDEGKVLFVSSAKPEDDEVERELKKLEICHFFDM